MEKEEETTSWYRVAGGVGSGRRVEKKPDHQVAVVGAAIGVSGQETADESLANKTKLKRARLTFIWCKEEAKGQPSKKMFGSIITDRLSEKVGVSKEETFLKMHIRPKGGAGHGSRDHKSICQRKPDAAPVAL
ncbi:hypothetical protein ACD591_02445 [Rufibacter glacialis]|uniref:Uncharacterized protein n=1 Tax=Rufibacter glacialis TaxID=1259555 RepID=A0A5M8QI95_9BACT|nr:hypothetical protein [Rufibacter glacialis]KAA6435749.1 hypothetical protein FOE74_07345 [Rufibacter glacialis]